MTHKLKLKRRFARPGCRAINDLIVGKMLGQEQPVLPNEDELADMQFAAESELHLSQYGW